MGLHETGGGAGAGGWCRAGALAREAAVSAVTQRLASLLTVAVVASVCVAVLLTAGRADGSAHEVLSSLDDSGTRSIIVRAEAGSGLDTEVLDRLRTLGGIEWFGAFGAADDVTNAAIDGGLPVSARLFYGVEPVVGIAGGDPLSGPEGADLLSGPEGSHSAPGGRASRAAAGQLGLADGVGAVVSRQSGTSVDIDGLVDLSPDLRFLEPVVLLPAAPHENPAAPHENLAASHEKPVAALVIRADSPQIVGAVAAAVTSVLGVDDPTTVTVQTSERLAAVRHQVENQLGEFGRTLVLSTFAGSSALVAAILFALVMMRRRDFGRRRALGATRSLIVALLLGQVGLTAGAASVFGTGVAVALLALLRQPLPPPAFAAAVAILAVTTSLVAALLPAVFASTRDPLRELRVP
ncbi:hypothetical protein B7R22_07115 [Subtercola boreus]|uniref:ABC3 transporter permease C-terminal domain-containing protein n=1 Tax=Subtercola boreus TaxID=120213 RepID=A0A3E0VZQ9_9MICO|nr:FtsX-like permease family protein [Subtercola boreus]RFA15095.1 hypothetical protein B7R22_07115 [Subtercola boreus]